MFCLLLSFCIRPPIILGILQTRASQPATVHFRPLSFALISFAFPRSLATVSRIPITRPPFTIERKKICSIIDLNCEKQRALVLEPFDSRLRTTHRVTASLANRPLYICPLSDGIAVFCPIPGSTPFVLETLGRVIFSFHPSLATEPRHPDHISKYT